MGKSAQADLGTALGALALRIVVSLMLVHHGLQKFYNPEGFADNMVHKWFPFLPSKALYWTYAAIVVELAGPVFLILGKFTRPVSLLCFCTMIFADVFHFKATGYEEFPIGVPKTGAYTFEPSVLCGVIFFYLLVAGPGKFAMDK